MTLDPLPLCSRGVCIRRRDCVNCGAPFFTDDPAQLLCPACQRDDDNEVRP